MELNGHERMFLQICSNIWKWIKDGHGASSFLETIQGKNALDDIEKIYKDDKYFRNAENQYLAIYDAVDDLAFKLEREKRLSHPEVQKAMANLTSKMNVFNSTKLGRIIAEEMAHDMGLRIASRRPVAGLAVKPPRTASVKDVCVMGSMREVREYDVAECYTHEFGKGTASLRRFLASHLSSENTDSAVAQILKNRFKFAKRCYVCVMK